MYSNYALPIAAPMANPVQNFFLRLTMCTILLLNMTCCDFSAVALNPLLLHYYYNRDMLECYVITSIKNNCLMKSEVGMAVLKSKQTRVVGVISTYV